MRTVRRSNRRVLVIALAPVMLLGGCGTGGNLPSGSLPGSLPGSIQGSVGTLPSRPETTTPPASSQTPPTSSETTPPPTSTETTPPTTSTETPPPTTTKPPPTATGSTEPPGTTSQTSQDETPWGWIALGAVLLLAAVLIAGWLLGRRRESHKNWRAAASQAEAEGQALHDSALATAISAASANRRSEWSAHAGRAEALAADLRRLEQSAPGPEDVQSAAAAATAVDAAGSAMAVAAGAPEGAPLDDAAGRMLRARLEEMTAATARLGGAPPAA